MCSHSFWLVRNEPRIRSRHACSSSVSAYGSVGIDRREKRVPQRVTHAVDLDRSGGVVDAVEQAAVFHVPLGVARDHLPFELELHDRRRLLHPGDRALFPHAGALALKAGRRVVGVHLARQLLERLQRDAVAFFELGEPAVAQGNAQHVADQRVVPEAGAEPGDVVVAPDERHVRLLHEVVDDPVAARAAVPAVAGDDQLVDGEVADQPAGQVDEVQRAAAPDELVDDRLEVADFPLRRGRVENLGKQLAVLRGERRGRLLEALPRGQHAHDLEKIEQRAHRILLLRRGRREFALQRRDHFRRVEDERQKFLEPFGRQLVLEQLLDQRPQRAGGVVDDVAQLFVLAVDVADDVDRALGQGQLGGEPGDLGHGGIDVGHLAGQGAERRQFRRVKRNAVAVGVHLFGGKRKQGGTRRKWRAERKEFTTETPHATRRFVPR